MNFGLFALGTANEADRRKLRRGVDLIFDVLQFGRL
jgi:hypothetical protein